MSVSRGGCQWHLWQFVRWDSSGGRSIGSCGGGRCIDICGTYACFVDTRGEKTCTVPKGMFCVLVLTVLFIFVLSEAALR